MSESRSAYIHVDRFLIPSKSSAAIDFYLNSLAIPHSRRETLYLKFLRRSPRPVRRSMLAVLSEQNPQTAVRLIAEVSDPIQHFLEQKGMVSRGPVSFIALLDYKNSARDQTVFYIFDQDTAAPVAVAKVTSQTGNRLEQEYRTLMSIHEQSNEFASRTSPVPLGLIHRDGNTILFETFLAGRSIYFEMRNLTQTATTIAAHFRMALDWLIAFQRPACAALTGTAEWKREHLRILEQCLPLCDLNVEVRKKMEFALQTLEAFEHEIPAAPLHGDFWAKNCIIQNEALKVVDWDQFQRAGFPLFDAFLFAVSYGLNFPWKRGKWIQPASALRAIFYQTNLVSACIQNFLVSYCRAMDLSPEVLRVFLPVFLAEKALQEQKLASVPGKPERNVWFEILHEYSIQNEPPRSLR